MAIYGQPTSTQMFHVTKKRLLKLQFWIWLKEKNRKEGFDVIGHKRLLNMNLIVLTNEEF